MLDTGIWLVWVTLDQLTGMTVIAVDADGAATPLGSEGYVDLFPTRSGLADFLASGTQHTLAGRTAGFDPYPAEFAAGADFSILRNGSEFPRDSFYDELWWPCGVLCAACGIDVDHLDPDTLIPRVAARTRLRTDFEQPGYAEADYWLQRQIVPFTVVLPSGTGMSLADEDVVCGVLPTNARFLGEANTVWLFPDEQDLLDTVANGLPAALDDEPLWQRDINGRPPHCHGSTRIDLIELPLLRPETEDTLIDALGVLENLVWTLTGSRAPFLTKELRALTGGEPLKPRHQRKAAELLRRLVTEVDAGVTWR
jgi:hypothetical protein